VHHETTILLIEVGALLFALGMLGRLGRRVGLSPIPLYLLAGLAFGQGGLLPLSASEEFIEVGAEIGVILLLVMLGLEYSAAELVANLRASAPAGAVDMLLNALPGAGFALLLGWGWQAAVVLAGITWVSSSGVIAKILGDLGRLGNRETPVILSVLVIEDLAMAFYLPLVTAVLAGVGLIGGLQALAVAVVTVTAVLVVAIRYGGAISSFMSVRDAEALLLSVLGMTLFVAGVAAELSVSAAVGAFLVGIALSGPVAHHATQILSPLRDLTDMPAVLLPALGLAVLTMATKVLTGVLAARRTGIALPGRVRAGLSLMPRGEFSVVIAGLAVVSGVEPELAPLATAYVLITVASGPLLARLPDYAWFKTFLRRFAKSSPPVRTAQSY
jgi:CPA2 family monovalent cation:H+ antiporter-2